MEVYGRLPSDWFLSYSLSALGGCSPEINDVGTTKANKSLLSITPFPTSTLLSACVLLPSSLFFSSFSLSHYLLLFTLRLRYLLFPFFCPSVDYRNSVFRLSICLRVPFSCMWYMYEPWAEFFKSGTNMVLDWWDFGGWRSSFLWSVMSIPFCEHDFSGTPRGWTKYLDRCACQLQLDSLKEE